MSKEISQSQKYKEWHQIYMYGNSFDPLHNRWGSLISEAEYFLEFYATLSKMLFNFDHKIRVVGFLKTGPIFRCVINNIDTFGDSVSSGLDWHADHIVNTYFWKEAKEPIYDVNGVIGPPVERMSKHLWDRIGSGYSYYDKETGWNLIAKENK